MKLILINVVYNNGSTGKVVKDIHQSALSLGIDALAYYGRLNRIREKGVYKFCTEFEAAVQKIWNKAGGLMYGGSPFSTWRLISRIKKERPDIVHLHCINGYCVNIYKLLKFLAKNKIKTVVTNRAEFFYTGNCAYSLECNEFMKMPGCINCERSKDSTGSLFRKNSSKAWLKMYQAFQMFDKKNLIFTGVSPWVKTRLELSPITNKFISCAVENGLDTSIFKHRELPAYLKEKMPDNGQRNIIHVTAVFSDSKDAFKGGDKIIDLAKQLPDLNFIVVATHVNIKGVLPANITFIGRASSQEDLAALYSYADLTVITSKKETFSMIVAETLACGTPIVGFKAGGPETITIPEYSKFVEYGDMNALKEAIKEMLLRKFDKKEIVKEAFIKYDRNRMIKDYIRVYNELLSE